MSGFHQRTKKEDSCAATKLHVKLRRLMSLAELIEDATKAYLFKKSLGPNGNASDNSLYLPGQVKLSVEDCSKGS